MIRRQLNNFPHATSRPCGSAIARPLTSIVLPVYNHADFLAESIESVLAASDYPLELIVVDDGSTDATPSVLKRFEDHPGIRLFRQENAGIAAALNFGFSQAKGSFFGWTSADNLYLPAALDYLIDYLLLNPSLSLVYGNVQLIDESGAVFKDSSYRTQDQSAADSSILQLPIQADSLLQMNDNFVNACFLYRADLAQKVGEYSSSFLGYEDYDYWMRLAVLAPIAHLDLEDPIYRYRLHRNSLSARLDGETLSKKQNKLRQIHLSRHTVLRSPQGISAAVELSPLNSRWRDYVESALISCGVRIEDSSSALPLALRSSPAETSKKVFRHPGHSLCSAVLPPLEVSTNVDTSRSPVSAPLYLPPVSIPSLIKRARDSSYNAVHKSPDSLAAMLCFTPEVTPESFTTDPFIAQCLLLLRDCPLLTLVLYCSSKAQRELADFVFLQSEQSSRLRIVDCSEQQSDPIALQHSLLYLLSSVDAVLSNFTGENCCWEKLLELRVEAAFAASAGVPIFCLMHTQVYQDAQWRRGLGFLPIPHLILLEYDKIGAEKLCVLLHQHFGSNSFKLSQGSLDQWLQRQSSTYLGHVLKYELLKTGSASETAFSY